MSKPEAVRPSRSFPSFHAGVGSVVSLVCAIVCAAKGIVVLGALFALLAVFLAVVFAHRVRRGRARTPAA